MRLLFLAAAVGSLGPVLAPAPARANGRPAATASVSFDGAQTHRVLAGATFGLLVSDDDGATWRLVCEDPVGTAGIIADPIFRGTPAGLLLVGSPVGLLYSRDGGCSFSGASGSVVAQSISDLAVSPTNPSRVLATTDTAGAQNGVHVSNDGGTTYSAPTNAIAAVARGVAFAGDGQRAYALFFDAGATRTSIYRSEDGGSTFAPAAGARAGADAPRLLGVSPTNRDGLAWAALVGTGYTLFWSSDGGATSTTIAADVPYIYGGAFAEDGSLYVATTEGVRKVAPGSTTLGPAPVGSPPVTCVSWRAGALYGCASEEATGFSLGRSTDEGTTWTPILRFSHDIVGPLACAAGTDVCLACYPKWPTFAMQFNIANATAPLCLGPPTPDASLDGPGMVAGGRGGGCGCRIGSAKPAGGAALLALVAGALRLRGRWRRR